MVSISFHSLELQNYEGWERNFITVELRGSFNVEPTNKSVRLMYTVYNSKNEIIDTLVNGFKNYYNNEFIYPKFDSRLTTDGNIRVDAWLVGNTLVRRYDIGTTKGAKEFNRVSNITSRNISLRKTDPIIEPHKKQEMPTFTGTVEGTGFKRGQAYQPPTQKAPIVSGTKPFEKPERVSVFKTTVSKAPIEILPEAAAEPEQLPTKCYMVFGRKLELTRDAVNYYKNRGVKIEECKIDLDFNGVSTPVTTQGGEEILITEPTEPAQLPAQALPIGFTGIIAGLIVLGGLLSWGDHKRRKK